MQRRHFHHASLALLVLSTTQRAHALTLGELTNAEASSGVKAALAKGAEAAVALLGQPGGFAGNPRVRIPLPGFLENVAQMLRPLGQGHRVDELVNAMNRAAEQAVPMGRDLLVKAVQSMTVTDAKNILTGGDTSVTQFFADKTRTPLQQRFLPVVTKSMQSVGVAQQYNALVDKVGMFARVPGAGDAKLEPYVTGKTLDGLYTIIGEEEKKIRQDPIGTGSSLLGKVFGAVR